MAQKHQMPQVIHNPRKSLEQTLKAIRSLSRLWPIRMLSDENFVRKAAWTSRRVVVTPFKSSSVTPLHLNSNRRQCCQTALQTRLWYIINVLLADKIKATIEAATAIWCNNAQTTAQLVPAVAMLQTVKALFNLPQIPIETEPLLMPKYTLKSIMFQNDSHQTFLLTWCCNPEPFLWALRTCRIQRYSQNRWHWRA